MSPRGVHALPIVALLTLPSCGLHERQTQPVARPAVTAIASASPSPAPAPSPAAAAIESGTAPAAVTSSTAVTEPERQSDDPGAALWNRTFTSTAVHEKGRPSVVFTGTAVSVAFERRGPAGVARWRAGCNTMGADVVVTEDRLELQGPTGGTAVGCDEERMAQDRWLNAFFGGDPEYLLEDARLVLREDDIVIELTESSA